MAATDMDGGGVPTPPLESWLKRVMAIGTARMEPTIYGEAPISKPMLLGGGSQAVGGKAGGVTGGVNWGGGWLSRMAPIVLGGVLLWVVIRLFWRR